MQKVKDILSKIENLDALSTLKVLSELENERVIFSTSLGYEDQIITDFIFANHLNIKVFTLDTGRLFPETYSVLSATLDRYKESIDVYYPKNDLLEKFVTTKGINSFYESIENRKECCHIRKVEPLQRALKDHTIWVTGIRTEQSGNRHDMPMVEWDEANQIIKIHPLLHWTFDEVKKHIAKYNIPYNTLHDKGYISIGCQPCTRAVREGEDFRAGRWWWEGNDKKECGLHST